MDLDPSPSVWRVLAEAALHHVWDQAAGSDKSLAEWWRIPSSTKDIGTLLGILENAESLLQQWRSTWLQPTEITTSKFLDSSSPDVSTFANSITSFMGTLTHFSIVSFATPVVSHQLAAKTGSASFYTTTSLSPELSSLLDCVLKSADAAKSF
ncbi:hypothetical protein N7476_001774 [Penicillium atrosanguineum]|uniref:Uncharacterized protein n=1 Tax=Penicillium atrosanguineum TaxID=1132637 RepID=A0A9W9QE29_9EURO|nr:hypothetical protein N7476_001774 [Penicillium atrosanguineum]